MKKINQKNVQYLLTYKQTLIAVTKTVGVDLMEDLYNRGVRDFGENRVETFLEKVEHFKDKDDIYWHYIGALQSRQVKKVINHINYFHALSTQSVAKEIEKNAKKPVKCFIQVNCSNEAQKSGLRIEEVNDFYALISEFKMIEVIGFMTMAAHTEDKGVLKETFQKLREIRDTIDSTLKLSMGMSNDYEIAIEEGSDFIRVGSALFKNE